MTNVPSLKSILLYLGLKWAYCVCVLYLLQVEGCKVQNDDDGQSRGYAFVTVRSYLLLCCCVCLAFLASGVILFVLLVFCWLDTILSPIAPGCCFLAFGLLEISVSFPILVFYHCMPFPHLSANMTLCYTVQECRKCETSHGSAQRF